MCFITDKASMEPDVFIYNRYFIFFKNNIMRDI